MAVPTWLSALGHLASDVAGGIIGAKVGEDLRRVTAEHAGAELKRVLLPDRAKVMAALLYLGEDGEALINLLREANAKGFIELPSGKRYRENWIVNMLLKIEVDDQPWVYPILNDACAADREKFFTLLETLHNDVVWRRLQDAGDFTKRTAAALNTAAGKANLKLRPTADSLRSEARQKGLGSWADC